MNDVLKTIKNRRSVRKYKPEQISREELDMIIEAGIYAPSAGNQQTWHFTVIRDQGFLQRMSDAIKEKMAQSGNEWMQKTAGNPDFMVTYNAPALILVSGREDGMAWQVDCSLAMQNIMLAAESLGIGSVCLGMVHFLIEQDKGFDIPGIPKGYKPFYAVALGYKADSDPVPVPKRNMDVVNYIG